jgi:hypothetical protein
VWNIGTAQGLRALRAAAPRPCQAWPGGRFFTPPHSKEAVMQYRHFPAPRLWRLLCLAAAACGLAACGNLNSIHRTLDTASGTGALIDAKQRAIIVGQRVDANGNRRYVACAEPSPDAMSAYAAEFAGELALSPLGTDGTSRSAAIKSALQEAAAHIGMRTPSIQLLRDAMYRVCEAYAIGGIDEGQYELLMRRYQRQIVAMMAIEQLTQAGRVPPVTLTTEGGVGGERPLSEWTDEIKRQQDLLAKQESAVVDAQKTLDKASEDASAAKKVKDDPAATKEAKAAAEKSEADAEKAKKAATDAKVAAQAQRAQVKNIITTLEKNMVGGAALAGRTVAEGVSITSADTARQIVDVQDTVRRLAMTVIDNDDTGALCFNHYANGKGDKLHATIERMCNTYIKGVIAENKLRNRRLDECTAQPTIQKVNECMEGRLPLQGAAAKVPGPKGKPDGATKPGAGKEKDAAKPAAAAGQASAVPTAAQASPAAPAASTAGPSVQPPFQPPVSPRGIQTQGGPKGAALEDK